MYTVLNYLYISYLGIEIPKRVVCQLTSSSVFPSGWEIKAMPPIKNRLQKPRTIFNLSLRKKWPNIITKTGAPCMMEWTLPISVSWSAWKIKNNLNAPVEEMININNIDLRNQWYRPNREVKNLKVKKKRIIGRYLLY